MHSETFSLKYGSPKWVIGFTELAAGHEVRQLVLDLLELAPAVALPRREGLGELGGLVGIALERRGDVHPVEGRQMIKMDDVIVQAVRGEHQVADVLRVERDLQVEGVLHGAHRGDGVDGGADAADALGEQPRLARVTPLQDDLDAAPHLAGGPGVADLASVHLDVDAQMSFDAGDGIDYDALSHFRSS